MLRQILGVVTALALPSALVGQAPPPPNPAAAVTKVHGIALHIQGEVVGAPNEIDVAKHQDGPDAGKGEKQDREGLDKPDGLRSDLDVDDQVDQGGKQKDVQDDTPAPPPGAAHARMIGRHRP